MRIAASEWNLVEISNGSDRKQAIRRAEFVERLKPVWIMERLVIQKQELNCFIWSKYFKHEVKPSSVFVEYLSVLQSYYAGEQAIIGSSAIDWVQAMNGSNSLRGVNNARGAIVPALKTLQEASQKHKQQSENEVFRRWLFSLLPDRTPDKKPICLSEKQQIIEFCSENKKELYEICPAIAVEDALSTIRTQDSRRHPEEQDAVDLQHSVIGLAYCDFYITRDGYHRVCVERAGQMLKPRKTAKVYKSIQAFIESCL